jgi:hypothetical protein
MKKVSIQVELHVIRSEYYDFLVEVDVPEDVDTNSSEFDISELEEEAESLAIEKYWSEDQRPYDAETDDINLIEFELWD